MSAFTAASAVLIVIVPVAQAIGHAHGVAGLVYVPVALAALACYLVRADLPVFGLANSVTLLRLGFIAVLAAGLVLPTEEQGLPWTVAGLAALTLALDGVDGWLARRTGRVSAFGARFDMEVDTGFILVGSLLLVHGGKVEAWVLLGPLLRPAFLLAARPWPWFGAPLPPSLRRKALCALFGLGLVAALSPPLGPVLASSIMGLGLFALVLSFAIDIRWLHRRAKDA